MGQRILLVTIGLTGVAIGVGLIALLFLPVHKVLWFLGPVAFFSVETHMLTVNIECAYPTPKKICEPFEANPTLEEFAQQACSPAISGSVANLCDGAYHAYVVGLMLVIVFVMNIMLQGAAMYSFNYYMTSSMRKKYRKIGVILQSIGVFFVVAVLVIYYAMVITYLNGVKIRLISIVGASNGAGASYGYFFMWISCVLQIGSILLSVVGAGSSQEELVEEAREQARFAAEMGTEMTGTYGQQGMYPGMQPQQMQPQMGMYAPGMGGFQQPGFQQPGFR